MANTFLGEMVDGLCRYWDYYIAALGLLGIFLLLAIAGLAVIEPGTPTYVVNLANIVALSTFIVVIGGLMVYCFRSGRVHK